MPSRPNEFEQLMERIRSGDPQVGEELFHRYGKAIQMVVRYHMDQRLRSQFDSLDFTQDAWASFFRVSADNPTFRTPQELVAFLLRIAHFKMLDAYRKNSRHSTENGYEFRQFEDGLDEQPSRQPTPSQVAIAKEKWDRLIKGKPAKLRLALQMLRDGYSKQEVTERLGLNIKRIQRLLKQLNDRTRSS